MGHFYKRMDGFYNESGIPWHYDPKYWQYWQSVNASTGLQSNDVQNVGSHYIQTISYWRSLALGLQFENSQLHQLIYQLTGCVLENDQPGSSDQSADPLICDKSNDECDKRDEVSEDNNFAKMNKVKKRQSKISKNKKIESNDCEGDTIDEDYLKFAMETAKHRKERDSKGQEKFNLTVDGNENTDYCKNAADNITVDHERLKKEMGELFGKDALKVHCLETRIELDYNEWSDKHRPVTWPALPLNMK